MTRSNNEMKLWPEAVFDPFQSFATVIQHGYLSRKWLVVLRENGLYVLCPNARGTDNLFMRQKQCPLAIIGGLSGSWVGTALGVAPHTAELKD